MGTSLYLLGHPWLSYLALLRWSKQNALWPQKRFLLNNNPPNLHFYHFFFSMEINGNPASIFPDTFMCVSSCAFLTMAGLRSEYLFGSIDLYVKRKLDNRERVVVHG